ncbi:hypothetical protein GCM10028857_26780 [Salinarchaeum chitinilyticum]
MPGRSLRRHQRPCHVRRRSRRPQASRGARPRRCRRPERQERRGDNDPLRSDDGVEELLQHLEADRKTVAETDAEALEAEIDEAVYDLFELTEDERDVVEEYLKVF